MQLSTIASTIQLIIAPVVMVSACAILLTGLLSRYAVINDRMRLMARERLDLLGASDRDNPLKRDRLKIIDSQLPLLLQHHWLAHQSVLVVYLAVTIFILDMLAIALAAVAYMDWVGIAILALFVLGMAALFAGMIFMVREILTSHKAVHYEIMETLKLADKM